MTTTLPGIDEYGLIGDTRTAALVGRGSIDWWCLPRFDSEPVFGRLVGGERAGCFAIAPAAATAPPVARYLPDSAVIATTWDLDGARVTVTDGLVAEPGGGLRPQALLVRRLLAEGRGVRVRVRFDPRRGADHRRPHVDRRAHGLVCAWPAVALGLLTDAPGAVIPGEQAELELVPGQPVTFAVAAADREPLVLVGPGEAGRLLDATDRWWRGWAGAARVGALARDAVVRSLVTLRLLTYAPSGAPVASASTSLPEWPAGARNWDYRYAWVRDASIGVAASLAVGNDAEASAFLYWLLHASRLHRPRLPPAVCVDGRPAPEERELPTWPGYRSAQPVRFGNAASLQHQLDGYGWVVDAAWQYHRAGRPLYAETWRMVAGLADFVSGHWRLPDAGIWERRDDPRHYVHSKLMGWLALDRALRMAGAYRTGRRRLRRWQREHDALAADIRARGFDRARGCYVRAYGTDDLDAALLLLPLLEFDPPGSPAVSGTIAAVRRELSAGGPLVYRYPPGSDGLAGPEGAFVPCSFWLVQALAATGRSAEAQELFAQLLARASPLGLFAEELHPETGEHLGNVPMAFSHAALLQAALALGAQAPGDRNSPRVAP